MSAGDRARRGLYPFLYDDAPPPTNGDGTMTALLEEVRRSTLQKAADVVELRRRMAAEYGAVMVQAAEAMAGAFRSGGKLLAIGNGGSATDAQDAAADCLCPPLAGWQRLPALALTSDVGVLTGVANDVGYEDVFARQVVAFGEAEDVLLAFTTSGSSRNIVAGLREARRRGMRTVALTGDEGGVIAAEALAEFCFVARTQHIPRVQEGHATVWHTLLELVHGFLAGGEAGEESPEEVGG